MYNLIMGGMGWDGDTAQFSAGRILNEYCDDTALARVRKPDGTVDMEAVFKLPTLFMDEGQRADTFARVGRVLEVKPASSKAVQISFALDRAIPAIPQDKLAQVGPALGIVQDFEWSRNHWAIKDADLYKVLLGLTFQQSNAPTVFHISSPPAIDSRQASAMMPFSAPFAPVYDSIVAAAAANRLRCDRADGIWEHPQVIQDIASLIDRSKVVICDCTEKNPNVFYEIGIAHALGREVILITQNPDDVPFDLRHLRYIRYLNNGEGRVALQAALTARIADLVR